MTPRDVWVSDVVAVRPSAIAGDGLFAVEDLPMGTLVLRLGGRVVTTAELERLLAVPDGPYVDTITVGDDAHLVLPSGSPAHYGNHSCDPNLALSGRLEIVTRRPVAAGEELTIDYATLSGAPGFSMPCTCGSACCRGVITSGT